MRGFRIRNPPRPPHGIRHRPPKRPVLSNSILGCRSKSDYPCMVVAAPQDVSELNPPAPKLCPDCGAVIAAGDVVAQSGNWMALFAGRVGWSGAIRRRPKVPPGGPGDSKRSRARRPSVWLILETCTRCTGPHSGETEPRSPFPAIAELADVAIDILPKLAEPFAGRCESNGRRRVRWGIERLVTHLTRLPTYDTVLIPPEEPL